MTDAEILAELAANPSDLPRLLIYADHYEQAGDLARAEFLRTEHTVRTATRRNQKHAEILRACAAKIGNDAWVAAATHPKIVGTTWEGDESDGTHLVARFLDTGMINYTQQSGTYENGTWKQYGSLVTFEMNKHYCDYTGLIIGGTTMTGKANNISGTDWTWKLVNIAATVDPPEDSNRTVYAWKPSENRREKLEKKEKAKAKKKVTPKAKPKAKPAQVKAKAKPAKAKAKATPTRKPFAAKLKAKKSASKKR